MEIIGDGRKIGWTHVLLYIWIFLLSMENSNLIYLHLIAITYSNCDSTYIKLIKGSTFPEYSLT